METSILKAVGQIAGIGGLAIGMIVIVSREVIRKTIFPNLTKKQAFRLLMTIVILSWSVALGGILAWAYVATISGHISTNSTFRVKITNQSMEFHRADKFVSASGSISGIVSDPYANVYLLGRRIHPPFRGETFWRIWKATTDADGNWNTSFFLHSSGLDFRPINFWEFFAIASKKPEDIEKFIIPQAGAIREQDLQEIRTAVACKTIVCVHSQGLFVDPSSIPRSRDVFKG